MDSKKFQIEVLERLTAIETTLKQLDYKEMQVKVNKIENGTIDMESRIKSNEKRLDKIEDNNKWLWRTVVGSIITIIIGAIATLIK
jgi:hypothetical protein